MIPGTQWDDDPYPTSLSSAAFVCFACALIWLFCAPLDLLSRPGQRLRTHRYGPSECADLGEENNHHGSGINE